eukprot:gene26574-biopygen16901
MSLCVAWGVMSEE